MDHGDVEARASHVGGDDVTQSRGLRERARRRHTRHRPRLRQHDGPGARLGRSEGPTIRLHHGHRDVEPRRGQPPLHRIEERRAGARRVGVQHGRRHALVLADDREELRGARDLERRVPLGGEGGHAPLVDRIPERPEETDGERLDALFADETLERRRDLGLVERHQNPTVTIDPLPHRRDAPPGDERRERMAHAVDAKPVAARHRPEVREAAGHEEPRRRAGTLGEAVRDRGRAEGEVRGRGEHLAQRDRVIGRRRLERGHETVGQRAGRGRRLATPAADAVGQEAVGEGASDVDADRVGRHAPRDNTHAARGGAR